MSEPLQEFVDSRGLALRVDREHGVLRGVKLIGLESRNGRRYQETALADAAALYEEIKVNVNHPAGGPLAPRDYRDRLGVIRNVEFRAGEGLFGDLHFNPKHALAEQLLWDAQHNPRNVGFSHNVLAKLQREGASVVVEAITKVQSVDLVADPAATEGLFEQRGGETASVVEQLQAAREEIDQLRRQELVWRLAAKHRLPIADEKGEHGIKPALLETLFQLSDESQLEQVISEWAQLHSQATERRDLFALRSKPQSRDQLALLASERNRCANANEFARLIKSGVN
jgi:hypothetical protein